MLCALCASAVLAQLTDGVVLGDDDWRPVPPEDAIAAARQYFEAVAKPPDEEPEACPAEIERHLRPLLDQRRDLVLIGGRLIIRPVRHLLRGALLDRTSGMYDFRIWEYIEALHDPAGARLRG